MVSIIQRSEYFKSLDSDKYTLALVDFLFSKKIEIDLDIPASNANNASVFALNAIQENNKERFTDIYQEMCLRKPKSDSDWIYNDIFIFSFTLGVCKFKLDNKWLNELLDLRISHSQEDNKLVAQTFMDLLRGNLENTNNFQPLMLVLKYYLDLSIDDERYINQIYDDLIQKNYPHYKSPFLNIVSLRAFDIIVLSKGLVDIKQQKEIENFIGRFRKRVHQIAYLCWLILLLVVSSISVWFFFYYLKIGAQGQTTYDAILTFFPYLSVGSLVGIVVQFRKKLIELFEKPFFLFYGFKPDKIIKNAKTA